MTGEKSGLFWVLAAEERLPGFMPVSRIFSEFYKQEPTSAGRLARHCWGILGSGLTEEKAKELALKSEANGVKTLILPFAGPPDLAAPPVYIKTAAFGPGTLECAGDAHFSLKTPYADILALAAAPLKEETLKTVKTTEGPTAGEQALRLGVMAVTGLPIGMGKAKEVKKEVKTSETAFLLDMVLKQPGPRLRLNPAHFDFSCLKGKKTCSSQINFNLLCAELAALAPKALKNTGLWAILEHKPLSALPYDSIEDFEKEIRRLTALAAAPTRGS